MSNQNDYSSILAKLCVIAIIALGLLGFLMGAGYNFDEVKTVLTVILYIAPLYSFTVRGIYSKNLVFGFFLIAYCIISFIKIVIVNEMDYRDFFIAYVIIFNAIILLLTPKNATLINPETFYKYSIYIYILFITKYTYSYLLGNFRPGVFIENNFELMSIFLLYIGEVIHNKKIQTIKFLFLTLIVAMSGSRSGMMAYIAVVYLTRESMLVNLKSFFIIYIIPLFGVVVIVSADRFIDISSIDRVQFMYYFISELKERSIFSYLFGAPRLTFLSDESCAALAHFEDMHSFTNPSQCLPLILHSMHFRAILDHGLILYAVVFFSLYVTMKSRNFSTNESLSVFSVLVLNGFSVSGLYSIFFALPLLALYLMGEKNN